MILQQGYDSCAVSHKVVLLGLLRNLEMCYLMCIQLFVNRCIGLFSYTGDDSEQKCQKVHNMSPQVQIKTKARMLVFWHVAQTLLNSAVQNQQETEGAEWSVQLPMPASFGMQWALFAQTVKQFWMFFGQCMEVRKYQQASYGISGSYRPKPKNRTIQGMSKNDAVTAFELLQIPETPENLENNPGRLHPIHALCAHDLGCHEKDGETDEKK